jgi:hypothetical protein
MKPHAGKPEREGKVSKTTPRRLTGCKEDPPEGSRQVVEEELRRQCAGTRRRYSRLLSATPQHPFRIKDLRFFQSATGRRRVADELQLTR